MDLEKLKKRWSSKDLDEDERFLRDFLLNKEYEEGDVNDQIPTYDEIVGVEESEDQDQRAEEFEHKYNVRFKEPDQEFMKTYPRMVQSSLRKPESKNKEQRQKKKARQEEKKRKVKEEIRELKAMKRAEIEEKLRKLKEATGDDSVPLSVEDLEKDFDPTDYDRRMHEIFAQEYYENGDEEAEKPVFSDLSSDADSNYDEMEIRQADDEEQGDDQNGAGDVDDHDEEEATDEPGPSRRDKKKKRKRNTKFREAVARQKPVFDPKAKTFDEYFKEYYALDYEDIIANDLVTKFKYRSVPANSFGLITEEVCGGGVDLGLWHISSESLVSVLQTDAVEGASQQIYSIEIADGQILAGGTAHRVYRYNFAGEQASSIHVPTGSIRSIHATRQIESRKLTLVAAQSSRVHFLFDFGYLYGYVDVTEELAQE